MKPHVLMALALVVLCSACEPGARLVTTEPGIGDVVGRYALSYSKFESGVDSEILSKARDAYIELMKDGQVILHKVPIVPESRSREFAIREFRSGAGRFEIAPLGSTKESSFYGLYMTAGELPDPMGHPRFRQKGPSLFLSFDYFDGDFTERMMFARQ